MTNSSITFFYYRERGTWTPLDHVSHCLINAHLFISAEERKYKCHLCPYAAKCRANLNQHLTIHSVKLVNTDAEHIVTAVTHEGPELKNCPYYYSCHVCGFQTEFNAQFVSHMSLHVDKEQWMFSLCCSTSEYVGVDEAEMKAHIGAGHTGKILLFIVAVQ